MRIIEIAQPLPPTKNSWRRGSTAYYEYHCLMSHESSDAQLWYRSHQPVMVLNIAIPGYGKTLDSRIANGEPRVYRVRFQDGHEAEAWEDELLTDPGHYEQAYCPPPEQDRQPVT